MSPLPPSPLPFPRYNTVFRQLSEKQKTQLEEVLTRRRVKAGEHVWRAGELVSFAVIVDSGCVQFEGVVPQRRETLDPKDQSNIAAALNEMKVAGDGGASGAGRGAGHGAGGLGVCSIPEDEKVEGEEMPVHPEGAGKGLNLDVGAAAGGSAGDAPKVPFTPRPNEVLTEVALGRGAIVGDIDALMVAAGGLKRQRAAGLGYDDDICNSPSSGSFQGIGRSKARASSTGSNHSSQAEADEENIRHAAGLVAKVDTDLLGASLRQRVVVCGGV